MVRIALIIGTDTPHRGGLPNSMYMAPPVRVRLFNNDGKVEFSTLDPARLPKVRGRLLASGTLQVGDTIEVGDRVFGVGGHESSELLPDTPLPMCPEARLKRTLAKTVLGRSEVSAVIDHRGRRDRTNCTAGTVQVHRS